jgi:hypothetical protein
LATSAVVIEDEYAYFQPVVTRYHYRDYAILMGEAA